MAPPKQRQAADDARMRLPDCPHQLICHDVWRLQLMQQAVQNHKQVVAWEALPVLATNDSC